MHAYKESQTFKGFQFGVEVTYPNFIMLIDVFKSADGHSIFSFCLEKSFQYFSYDLWFIAFRTSIYGLTTVNHA